MAIQPPTLPYQASGTSFAISRRVMITTTADNVDTYVGFSWYEVTI